MAANEPIVAIATGAQKAPVSIIRISGEDISPFLRSFGALTPRYAHYRDLTDDNGEIIDSGVVIYFKAPHSFTGEDIIEFQGHGGRYSNDRVLSVFQQLGARPARPGEFTERAFLNGKIDLAQAEAIADLIDAQSMAASKAAMRALTGTFSTKINEIEQELRRLRSLVEGAIDFSDEEIEFIQFDELIASLHKQQMALDNLLAGARHGRYLRDGVKVALIGAPNVGKSTLLNTLIGEERAITSDIAGTTRDVIDADFELEGIPVTLLDTAGIHDSNDRIEKMGIERSHSVAETADIIILMSADNERASFNSGTEIPTVRVMNKSDVEINGQSDYLAISAKTGDGIDELRKSLLALLNLNETSETQFTARQRHIAAIKQAQEHITLSITNAEMLFGIEFVAEEIRLAHDSLGEITGNVYADDILGDIFSSFCIGK